MDWKEILATVVPILVAILGVISPMIIMWLKNQKIIQKFQLEDLVSALIPQIVEWVETWAETLEKEGKKPSGGDKLAKGMEFAKALIPWLKNNDEIVGRIEAALKKVNGEKPRQLNG